MEFRRLKLAPVFLLVLLFLLQYRLWFESGGIGDMMMLRKHLAEEQMLNEKLKERNQSLYLQVEQLQKNQSAVESRARQELGMIKKGETFYQVVE